MQKSIIKDITSIKQANDILAEFAGRTDIFDAEGSGKAIAYMGWFWRSIHKGNVSIGITDDTEPPFIGIMQKNKWGYSERLMTNEEEDQLIAFANALHNVYEEEEQSKILRKLNKWMQSLTI